MKEAASGTVAVDRRVQKTKKYLSEALIALILEKGYEQVTIQDIVARANTGRSTFYTHYESKEQLLMDGHKNLGVAFFDGSHEFNFLPLFEHAAQNLHLAKAMFGKMSGNIIVNSFRNHAADKIKEQHKSKFGKSKSDKLLLAYYADAAAAAVISLLVSWMEGGTPFTSTEMAAQCQRIVDGIFSGR